MYSLLGKSKQSSKLFLKVKEKIMDYGMRNLEKEKKMVKWNNLNEKNKTNNMNKRDRLSFVCANIKIGFQLGME